MTSKLLSSDDLLAVKDKANAFAAEHVVALAQELIEWQDSGLLRDGKLRELAAIWLSVRTEAHEALNQAEHTAVRAAMEAVAAKATAPGN